MLTNENFIEGWKLARKMGETIPRKRDINPVEFTSYLPFIAILERRGAQNILIRLAGTGLEDLFNSKLQGKNGFDTVNEKSKPLVDWIYTIITEHSCGAKCNRVFSTEGGKQVSGVVTILPLQGKTEENPQYIIWYDIARIGEFESDSNRFVGYDYNDLEFIDLGNGIPEIDPNFFMDQ